jgi:hypothetical protein
MDVRSFVALLVALVLLSPTVCYAVVSSIQVDERNGLPTLMIGGAPALSSSFAFWEKDWKWAGMSSRVGIDAAFTYRLNGRSEGLGLGLDAEIAKTPNGGLRWSFEFDAAQPRADVIGGGISFKFNLTAFESLLGQPELLPDRRGWRWGRAHKTNIELTFDPPLESIHFERGVKSEIRAIIYSQAVPQGSRRLTATVTVSNDIKIAPMMRERFETENQTGWRPSTLDVRSSPVNLSFLNAEEKPAGKRGFLKVEGDKLKFQDGTEARFWGTNLTAYALFGSNRIDELKREARRLSALGFNLVRLHHHDSEWVQPNVFGNKAADTQHLNEEALRRLDWLIKALADEGIYVWLDLHVGRKVTAGDRIDGFEEIAKGAKSVRLEGYSYVNPSIQDAMRRFNEAYVNRVNSATGVRYKDEPAIVGMLITNENDVTAHYGNGLLPDKNVPWHNAIYMDRAADFAKRYSLSKDLTWRAWLHGPSKLFLNDLEHRYNASMIAHLRALGVVVPIATTNAWGGNPLSSLPSLTDGDLIDAHAYGGANFIEANPLYVPNLMHWLAAAQITGRPLSVTEWNVSPFPLPDRHAAPLYVAASASFQGWDALMQYAYTQRPFGQQGTPGNWEARSDPGLLTMMPAAALLFRRGDVQESKTNFVFAPSSELLFGSLISPETSVALRTAAERGRLTIAMPKVRELPWLEPSRIPKGATVFTDPKAPLIPTDAGSVSSDTGELRRDWDVGTYTINTPRSQVAAGWIGARRIALADVEIAAATPNATVAVQSLEQKPIAQSRSIMISLGAQSTPQGNNQPFRSAPVTGQLKIRAPAGLRLFTQHGIAAEARELPVAYAEGRYHIALTPDLGTYWLSLR